MIQLHIVKPVRPLHSAYRVYFVCSTCFKFETRYSAVCNRLSLFLCFHVLIIHDWNNHGMQGHSFIAISSYSAYMNRLSSEWLQTVRMRRCRYQAINCQNGRLQTHRNQTSLDVFPTSIRILRWRKIKEALSFNQSILNLIKLCPFITHIVALADERSWSFYVSWSCS